MELGPELLLAVNRTRDLREFPLTPEDFFLFSRVEALTGASAGPTVGEVISASGQPQAVAERILNRLIELGLLRVDAPVAPTSRHTPDPQVEERRQRGQARRKELLEAQLRALSREPQSNDSASLPVAKAAATGSRPAPPEVAAPHRSILETVTPVRDNDPRLDPKVEIPLETQRRLLAVRDELRNIGHFAILGLEPTDDTRALRRAYHVASRDFHPDSFYGREIGAFRTVLDDLFRRARASFDMLGDESRRRALVEEHLAIVVARQAERDAEVRRELEAEQRAARVKSEALARETRAAEAAREARDQARKGRLREKMTDQRRDQARAHADQGDAELAAGKHGAAATMYRLAHNLEPDNREYEQKWRDCLSIARRHRADLCYMRGRDALQMGRVEDASRLLAEAAEADPSLRNLTEAANVVGEVDPQRARVLALAALEALTSLQAQGGAVDDATAARTHLACGRAFLAAGQVHTAQEQADRAHGLSPSEQTRALLNAIKLA